MEKVQVLLPPNIAATIATRVYDIRTSSSFKEELGQSFDRDFKITNNQIKCVSSGLINQLLNLAAQITGSLKG
jgi:triacylglycerol lipase